MKNSEAYEHCGAIEDLLEATFGLQNSIVSFIFMAFHAPSKPFLYNQKTHVTILPCSKRRPPSRIVGRVVAPRQ